MQVRLVISFLVVAAIGYAVKAKTTTPVVRSHIDSSDMSEDNDDGDRMISLDSLITKAKDILTTNPFKGLIRATKQPNPNDDQLVKAVEQPKPVDDQLEKADEIVDGQLEKVNEIIDDQLEKAYVRLQLRGSDDELFERLNGLLWLEEADELAAKYHRSTYALVIDSLTKRLGDKRVAELIQTTRKVSKTKAIAIKLKNAQMRYKLLDPNSSALKSLTTFFGEKGVSELLQFAPHISRSYLATGYDENALLLTIIEAEMNDKTKEIATKLKTELFKQYAFAEKAPADVLDLLKRNNLRTSQWSFFESYVNDYRRVTR